VIDRRREPGPCVEPDGVDLDPTEVTHLRRDSLQGQESVAAGYPEFERRDPRYAEGPGLPGALELTPQVYGTAGPGWIGLP
jgi:hypothetical protein